MPDSNIDLVKRLLAYQQVYTWRMYDSREQALEALGLG